MPTKTKQRTKNRKTPTNSSKAASADGIYLLKLVLYTILGTQWLWFELANGQRLPVPIGLLLGIVFATHEHFQVDRKIEYAVLLAAMLVGFVAHVGIFVTI